MSLNQRNQWQSAPLTLTHWGAYRVLVDGTKVESRPFEFDLDPSHIGLGADPDQRVAKPSIRRGWIERPRGEPTARTGNDEYLEVPWDEALDIAAAEIDRIRTEYGNTAVYGGSYGWSSAGRFHHAQSHLRRFLSGAGGYTDKLNTYSHAAGEVLIPHILGMTYDQLRRSLTPWPVLVEHTKLVIAFGGIPMRTSQIGSGGTGAHRTRSWLDAARKNGVRFVNVSPVRDDVADDLDAKWLPCRPGSDTAIVLAMIHTMIAEDLVDQGFIDRYTTGWSQLSGYVMGRTDGHPKDAAWAAAISELPKEEIVSLARDAASIPTMIAGTLALQRADHGEQPWWAIIALAAATGQIGTRGGGFGLGYGAFASVANGLPLTDLPTLPRLANPVSIRVPVARLTDMLLHPGATYEYNGATSTYPDIRLIYWAGGNPFHHQQDLNRLHNAWQRPETVIVNESFWTATARRADIVLPATTTLERTDIGGAPPDEFLFHMPPVLAPFGEARDDYSIFAGLAARMGFEALFTLGRSAEEWVEAFYGEYASQHPGAPSYAEFCDEQYIRHDYPTDVPTNEVLLAGFRSDPGGAPLATPSGRIELFSRTIAGFGYQDCPGHPTWLEPQEWLGQANDYPIHLISSQPGQRLHSQHMQTAQDREPAGSPETVQIHPADAEARQISTGDTVRLFNDRGACLGVAQLTDGVRPGVVVLPTGAWFDSTDPGNVDATCRRGNPNVLTPDRGTSRLSQGSTAHSCLIQIEPTDTR